MKRFFHGGIHPSDGKELSKGAAPSSILPPKQVAIPLQQHIGAPCEPLVGVGDRVLRYQKIGDGAGLCAPVHASVSGTVAAIEPRPHPSGRMVMAIVIENDFQNESVELHPAANADADTVLQAIREAGIVGMGGAAFPGNPKALSAMGQVDTLIANGCECEPYITADDCLLCTKIREVLAGMEILRNLLKPQRTVLAMEDNKQEAIGKIRESLDDYPHVSLMILPTRYPQGSEKQLIRAVTGREVAPGNLPVSVGCAVFNVSTMAAVFRAVALGMPLTERIVTVSGEAVALPGNFIVPIGTSFQDLIAEAGGLRKDGARVISGGPMMGIVQGDLSVPVVKATNSILCLPEETGAAQTPCLRCGKCVGVCPMGLQPLYFARFERNPEELAGLHILDCVECGCCAYICPGKLPLVETIRRAKQMLREVTAK